MARNSKPTDVTGRDGAIITKSLFYAIAHIQSLPPARQEESDMHDMRLIVRNTIPPAALAMEVLAVQAHTGTEIVIWPEADEELTPQERGKRDEFRKSCDRLQSQRLTVTEQSEAA